MVFRKALILFLLLLISDIVLWSQNLGVKTNVISDCLLSPNIGVELKVDTHWTVDISGEINGWNINGKRWRHWLVQPEGRYWLCEAFQGSFFAAHLVGGQYNIGNLDLDFKFLGTNFSQLKDRRFQGWGIGAGVGYGYSVAINRHWNFEAEIAIGWIYSIYDVFPCSECGSIIERNKHHNYVGPTKVSLAFEYLF